MPSAWCARSGHPSAPTNGARDAPAGAGELRHQHEILPVNPGVLGAQLLQLRRDVLRAAPRQRPVAFAQLSHLRRLAQTRAHQPPIRQRLGGGNQVRPEGGRRPLAHEVDDAAEFEDGEAMLVRGR